MPSKPTHTPAEVIAVIPGSAGIKTTIAKRLGVSRWTVDNYLERWQSVKAAYDEECESVIDTAESVVIKSFQSGETSDARWYLSRKGRHRGYVERQELTGENGQPFQIEQKVQVNSGTDHITAVLRTLVEVGAVELPATSASGDAETDALHPAPADA